MKKGLGKLKAVHILVTTLLLIATLLVLTSCFGANRTPIAKLTASPINGEAPLEISFEPSDSYDPDGRIINFKLDFGDGASPVISTDITRSITHTYYSGTFTAILEVTDNHGATDTDSITIPVKSPYAVKFRGTVVDWEAQPGCTYWEVEIKKQLLGPPILRKNIEVRKELSPSCSTPYTDTNIETRDEVEVFGEYVVLSVIQIYPPPPSAEPFVDLCPLETYYIKRIMEG